MAQFRLSNELVVVDIKKKVAKSVGDPIIIVLSNQINSIYLSDNIDAYQRINLYRVSDKTRIINVGVLQIR